MRPALKSWPGALNTAEAIILILFLLTQILPDHVEHNRLGGEAHSNNFPADVFLGAAHAMGRTSAMSIFPRSYRKKRSGYACALSSGLLVLSLALAAPAAYAAMGGAGGAASGTGGNAEAAHRPNSQTEFTTCAQGTVWNTKDKRCLARRSGVRPGARVD